MPIRRVQIKGDLTKVFSIMPTGRKRVQRNCINVIIRASFTLLLLGSMNIAFAQHYVQRSIDNLQKFNVEITSNSAYYKPIFGIGDKDIDKVSGLKRFGMLSLVPNGKSQTVNYGREELVYYVLEGSGTLSCQDKLVSITKDDFFYIPINENHGFSTKQYNLEMLVMGYTVPEEISLNKNVFQIANAKEVEFQTLENLNHGTTSRFKLLLGTTESQRDRLAAASQINSLFLIDFDPGGTNLPHRHPKEEEVYFVLQGTGNMVAGETSDGNPRLHPVSAGDAFYFSRNCLVGFYSDKKTKKNRSLILAIRSKMPPGFTD